MYVPGLKEARMAGSHPLSFPSGGSLHLGPLKPSGDAQEHFCSALRAMESRLGSRSPQIVQGAFSR